MAFKNNLSKFEKLYKDNFNFLCLVSYQITKDSESVKDIVQDFFIYLWEKEKTLEFNVSFKAYAAKAVKNLSLQHIEKVKKKISFNEDNLSIQKFEDLILFEKPEDNKTLKIIDLVNQIPESRRNIFISHVIDGLSYLQISELYDISINTVKTQMKRSYAFLRSIENSDLKAIILLSLFIKDVIG